MTDEKDGDDGKRKRGRPPGSKNKARPDILRRKAKAGAKGKGAASRRFGVVDGGKGKAAPPGGKPAAPQSTAVVEIFPPDRQRLGGPGAPRPMGEGEGEGAAGADFDSGFSYKAKTNGRSIAAMLGLRRRGRKPILHPDPQTLDRLFELAVTQANQHEIAADMDVSHKTLQRFMDEHPEARAAWEDGLQRGRQSLRANIFVEAATGNQFMLAHVSKHWLGMSDKPKDDEAAMAGAVPMEVIEAAADAFKRRIIDLANKRRATEIPDG